MAVRSRQGSRIARTSSRRVAWLRLLNSDLFNKDIEINSLYSSELILILITDATHLIIMVPLVVMAFLRLTHS